MHYIINILLKDFIIIKINIPRGKESKLFKKFHIKYEDIFNKNKYSKPTYYIILVVTRKDNK